MDTENVRMMLDTNTVEHYESRAKTAGRSWDEQIVYELLVNRGLVQPDVGDYEAAQRASLLRRVSDRRMLHG